MLNQAFFLGRDGHPGFGAYWALFDEEPEDAATGFARLYGRSDTGRWYDKRGTTVRSFALEQQANAFTLLNEFKDLELDDQDGTPVADRRLRTIDGLIRAATTGNVEGRYISKASLEALDTANINNDQITFALMQNITGPCVVGKSGSGSGDPAEISAAADDRILRRTGGALDFGQLTLGMAPANLWTYAKLQQVSATDRFLGRKTAGAGDIEELSGTEATARLDAFTSALKGLAPASGGGTTNFLRADGTWAAPGSGYTDEQAQDAVGGILTATAEITPTYDDATPAISFALLDDSVKVRRLYPYADEFNVADPLHGLTGAGMVLEWNTDVNGTGSAVNFQVERAGHFGVVELTTGTTTTGRSCFYGRTITSGLFGSDQTFEFSVYFKIPTLSTVGQEYELWLGFFDNTAAGDHVDAACVKYERLTSTNWLRQTSSNSTLTENASGTTTGTAVAVATGWQTIIVRGNSTQINFYHKPQGGAEVFLGSETTNIPSGAGRTFSFGIKIEKKAGTTASTVDIDTVKLGQRP